MRKIRLFFLLSLLTSLSVFYTVLNFYPYYLDVNYYKPSIEKALADLAGMPVSFGHIDFSVYHGLSLVVKDLKISSKTAGLSLAVKKSAILFKIVPLLKNREFVVKSLRLFSPEINVEARNPGEKKLLSGAPLAVFNRGTVGIEREKPLHGIFSAIAAAGIHIFNGKIRLLLQGDSASPSALLLDGFSFQSRPDRSGSFVEIRSGLNILSNGTTARVRVTGKFSKPGEDGVSFSGKFAASSLSLRLIEPYRSFPLYGFKPDTTVDVLSALETDFSKHIRVKGVIKEGNPEVLRGAPGYIKKGRGLPVTLNFDITRDGETVDISSLRLRGEGYSLLAAGKIRGIFDKDPLIDFELKSSEVDLAGVKERIPDNLFGEKIDSFFNKSDLTGHVRLTKARYSGNYNALLKPLEVETLQKMTLVVELKDSATALPPPFDKIEKVSGIVRLENGDLFLGDAKFRYKNCDFDNMDISVKEILTSRVLSVSLNGDIDLAQIKPLAGNLVPASPLSNVDSPSGRAALVLKAVGTVGDGGSMKYEGRVDLTDAGFLYRGLTVPVRNLNGTLFFSESHVELERIEWEMGGGHFGVDGTAAGLKGPDPKFNLWLEADIDAENIEQSGISIPDGLLLKRGQVALSLSFRSDGKGFLLNGDMDLTAVEYLFRGFKKKAAGLNNKISFSGRYEDRLLTLNRGRVELGGSYVKISGAIPFSGTKLPALQVVSDRIRPEDIARVLKNLKSDKKGNISIGVKVNGETPFNYQKDLSARVKIRDMSIYLGKKGVPLKNINGHLDFLKNRLSFKKLTLRFDGGSILAKGFIRGFPKPDLMVDIEADRLNLNAVFPPKEKRPKDNPAEKNGGVKKRHFGKFAGKVEIDDGLYRNIVFHRAKMFLSIDKGGVSAKPFSVKGFDGNFTGAWKFLKGREKTFSIDGSFNGIDMAALEKTFKIGLSDLEGKGYAKVSLSGSGEGGKEFKKTLNGSISLNIKNGRLHKFFLLSKIFSLLNLQVLNMSSKGMSYHSITADVSIKNGVIETKNFLLDSNSFRMTGVGKIDLGKSRIDMVVGVQPFQTLDKVISHIPVIGGVLTGKKKSLIVSYYSVKGSLKKPVVGAKAVESIGKGVLGILKRVITLPRDLITGGE